jgi:hypothetical protein
MVQPPAPAVRQFPVGSLRQLEELPVSRLRAQLEGLPPSAQTRALRWLQSAHFTELDLPSLHADSEGGIYYVCDLAGETGPVEAEAPPVGQAAVPVHPLPASLAFHSRPGAPNVLYLNFAGETVSNTAWNRSLNRSSIPALPFSIDSDTTTFSEAEQLAIRRIWQRVAEDYAPFNINVTTERPATFNTRTAHALITRNTDANDDPNPSSTAGGVAYLNVFGTTSYGTYRPVWVYHNNLGNEESYIAEAVAHEVGHNFGLTHDGKSDGAEYYGGHGSGEISWGPLMGTGYNRNVSHWCKGEYHLANNTQDDLAVLAGKIAYRSDDHGNTHGTATPLVVTGGTNIIVTTPETDPGNTQPANKGVLERNTDVDVFSFLTGSGAVNLAIDPWIVPGGRTRGGNVDLRVDLYHQAGQLLLSDNPASRTGARVQTNLVEGRYYLHVRNSAAGDPFNSTPTGYTAYGSLGQYFISGTVAPVTDIVTLPVAELSITDLSQAGRNLHPFTVTYSDAVALDVSTLDADDLQITGPNGYDRGARFLAVEPSGNGTPRVATYAAEPPSGSTWSPAHNGAYTISMRGNQVANTQGAWVAPGELGQFTVTVPVAVYIATMDVDPGWELERQWAYGPPAYTGGGPTSGFTGANIIGYNLSGNYPSNLPLTYATTPVIDCSANSSITLRFRRWLRLRNRDTASIQVSTNGSAWANVWSTSSPVSDSAWQEVQYTLPDWAAGSPTVRLRWGLASNADSNIDIGWNLDDVELLGDGSLDTTPPVPTLSVADITLGGAPSHACSVTYTDDTAVRLASLSSANLLVTGPQGYSEFAEFVGADLPLDGSPCTATYSIPAPGGSWEVQDNGVYEVTLRANAVEDIFNNATPETLLGAFTVAIPSVPPGQLEVTPPDGLNAAGTVGGPFSPLSLTYTLANTGGSTLDWTANPSQDWVSLSTAAGTLTTGASTTVTVSINAQAENLEPGSYSDSVSFINATSGDGNTLRPVGLIVSSPVISLSGVASAGQFQVTLRSTPHLPLVIELSTDLVQWTAVITNFTGADGTLIYLDTDADRGLTRYYRGRSAP